MKKIQVSVSTRKVGSKTETTIDVDDDAPESEIDEMAREAMFELINWDWREVTK